MKRYAAAVALSLAASAAAAQEAYPSRAISIIVPNPPGGMNQITAQPLSAILERLTKQPAPVINKPGGTAAVGTAFVATQKPDGYNILVTTPNLYLVVEKNKAQNIEAPYKLEQIQPIALTSADPLIFVVQTESPYKSIKEFIADAKAKDGQLAYSSSGPYGVSHIPFAQFVHVTGLKMRHVPTTGGGPAITALLGGHVDLTAGGPAAITPHVKAGKLRPLASWGPKRHPGFPDVPTFKELGYNIEYLIWAGMFAPRGTPDGTMKVLRDAARKAVEDAEFKGMMAKVNSPVHYLDAPEFQKFWMADAKRLAEVVKVVGKVEAKK